MDNLRISSITLSIMRKILAKERKVCKIAKTISGAEYKGNDIYEVDDDKDFSYTDSKNNTSKGELRHAEVLVSSDGLIISGGEFKGTIKGNVMLDNCQFEGTFAGMSIDGDSIFKGGEFVSGEFLNGVFKAGKFNGGVFNGGTFAGGDFLSGVFDGGKWTAPNTNWKGGEWKVGTNQNNNTQTLPPPLWDIAIEDEQRFVNFTGEIDLFDKYVKWKKAAVIPRQNPKVVNATFTKKLRNNRNELEWEEGTWVSGTWTGGVWKKGTWKAGYWTDGTWEDGTWESGAWESGTWQGGKWLGGTWKRGYDVHGTEHPNAKTMRNSRKPNNDAPCDWSEMDADRETTYTNFTGMITFNTNAKVKNATFTLDAKGILWEDGIWEYGTWNGGTWKKGTWESGTWQKGIWCGGTWKKGLDGSGAEHEDSPDNWSANGGQIADKPGSYKNFNGTIKVGRTYGQASNADFDINEDNSILWRTGAWDMGTLSDCTWQWGMFNYGSFENSVFKNGSFNDGFFTKSSVFENGTFNTEATWASSCKWVQGKDQKRVPHDDSPFNWGMSANNVHHPTRDALIKCIPQGRIVRQTFVWDEDKPNLPKVYKIWSNGLVEATNPFKNLTVTVMTSTVLHMKQYYMLPEYLGINDDNTLRIGKKPPAVPASLMNKARFFETFNKGEMVKKDEDIQNVMQGFPSSTEYFDFIKKGIQDSGLFNDV